MFETTRPVSEKPVAMVPPGSRWVNRNARNLDVESAGFTPNQRIAAPPVPSMVAALLLASVPLVVRARAEASKPMSNEPSVSRCCA